MPLWAPSSVGCFLFLNLSTASSQRWDSSSRTGHSPPPVCPQSTLIFQPSNSNSSPQLQLATIFSNQFESTPNRLLDAFFSNSNAWDGACPPPDYYSGLKPSPRFLGPRAKGPNNACKAAIPLPHPRLQLRIASRPNLDTGFTHTSPRKPQTLGWQAEVVFVPPISSPSDGFSRHLHSSSELKSSFAPTQPLGLTSSVTQMGNMSQAVKRACDACHRRKVKCDGLNPCRNCAAATLGCTYNAIPQKKGPKGSRAKVISELRENQRQTSLYAKVQNRLNNIQEAPSANWLPTSGLLTAEVVKQCAGFYFENLYPQLPILDTRLLDHAVAAMEQNPETYCLLTSFTAFIVLQPGMPIPSTDSYNLDMLPGANIATSALLLEETLRVRKGIDILQSVSVNSVLTNFFIFACFYANGDKERAWYYLREATTVMHMIGMHKEEWYRQHGPSDAARLRRLYWLFYSVERAYAIDRHRPLTLQATIKAPSMNDDPQDLQAALMEPFFRLVNVYQPFDDSFTATWNNARRHLNASTITGLQHRVNDIVNHFMIQDASVIDLGTNQQWLKNTIWQLNGGSISGNGDDSIAFQFPASRELLSNMSQFFPNQPELMTSGFIQKLLQTVSSLMDLLSILPSRSGSGIVSPQKHLETLIGVIVYLRQSEYQYLPLLLSKVSEVLPGLADPALKHAPENADFVGLTANLGDMFDGFSTAGLPQIPMQMSQEPQMAMESPGFSIDQKYSADEYDKQFMEMTSSPDSGTMSNATGGTPPVVQQSADLNNSFNGSPGLMSPVMEYPNNMSNMNNMNNFVTTPMADMVHSPLGNPVQSNPMNQLQGQHQLPSQHQQHLSNGDPMAAYHMGSIPSGMYNMRQPQQRQNSYQQMQGQPQMRTVQDFQGLQRGEGNPSSSFIGGVDFAMT
ncbi:Fc.00g074680.m01.CDS01 [Cosmosporella sp. VM-42]